MKIKSSSSKLYRGRLACLVLCMLSAVICPLARAGGSWLVDGQAVQSLEVQTTNEDPAALHTDGTRKMAAPLAFENSVSSPSAGLFKAYVPWDGTYDFFLFDEDEEALRLSNGYLGFYPTAELYIFGTIVGDANSSARVDLGETTLKGGTWMVDTVGPYNECIITKGYANSTYILRSEGITVNHTIQAGDVLQIQNGIITAINP